MDSVIKNKNLQSVIAKVNSMSIDKQQALIVHLKKQGIDITPYVAIPKNTNESDEDIELSFSQQRLWFLAKLEGNSCYYNIPRAWRLSGKLNKHALFRAIEEIIERHSVLRTRFVERDGIPYQSIDQHEQFNIQVEGISEDLLHKKCEEEAITPFDLSSEKLIRFRLLKLAETEHVLLVTMHHSVSDGWSLNIFFNEIKSLYTSICNGDSSQLKRLPIQYSDFTRWQRKWISGYLKEKQLDYWRNQLKDIQAQLVLPTDRPRPAVKTYNGSHEGFFCPPELLSKLHQLSNKHGATLFMTLLSVFKVLLWNYTQQTDLTVGTPIANRNRSEIENLIGFFVNTLVLRSDLSGNPTFIDLLDQVKTTAMDAYSNQDIPFESVVDALDLERRMSYSPLFQVMFVLQESLTEYDNRLVDLTISQVDYDYKIAKFDITLDLQETGSGLYGHVEYNSDLFDRSTIQRFIQHYLSLLKQVVENSNRRISEYEYISKQERSQLFVEWNQKKNYRDTRCLHEMFEYSCEKTPDRIAVTFEEQTLTYRELNERANQLAHCIQSMGVKPDGLVGLCVERSLEMVVSILGILKAGGAYVPIDPASPVERVRYILEDSGAKLLLTQRKWVSQLAVSDKRVLCLDEHDFDRYDTVNIPPPSFGLEPKHLAYVIYTSGSTGKPKGVLVEHRNVTRLLHATENQFGFNSYDVWTMFHSYAFDFSVWELWGALAYGGRVVIVPKIATQSLDDFYTLLVREKVTVLNQTPTVFDQLISVDAGRNDRLSLRYVIFGGEALKPAVLKPWFEKYGDEFIKLINMYGITETTVHVTYHRLRKNDTDSSQKSVIGKKLSDLTLYVLNEQMKPVPIGVTGHMYVSGAGVTRGYLNRLELTAERFIHNPFDDNDGGRMYDTGDLACWLPDGNLKFIGRADNQVKIRGFRIELGEIESRLLKHPMVEACCVISREEVSGNKMLVAYLVCLDFSGAQDAGFNHELSSFLKSMLPDYMVPSAYVILDKLPVTSNGKVDYKALPKPNIDGFGSKPYVAPNSETEILLARIWSELLGYEEDKISIHDNFFALGGHSLLIMKLIAKLKKHGLTCDVVTVFTAPSLEVLATTLDQQSGVEDYQVPENIIPYGCDYITPDLLPLIDLRLEELEIISSTVNGGSRNIQDIYPLVPSQEGILFHHMIDVGKDPYVIPVLFRFQSKERLDQFIGALQTVINRHDALRTGFITEGLTKPVQVVHRHAALPVEPVMLDPNAGAEKQMLEKLNEPELINIVHAPLLRLKLSHDSYSNVWYALFYMHHLIEDATSLKLIFNEMLAQFTPTADALTKPVPYRNFVAHTLHHLYDAEAFFRKKLGDITETTAPFGLYDVRGDGSNINSLRCSLPKQLSDEIRIRAKEMHISPASIFHAAWSLVVAICSGRQDVVFGTVFSGRLQDVAGVENMVGNFINTLPIRLSLAGKSVIELVRHADEELKELIQYEQSSLSLAQSCSSVKKDVPLFTAMLNYRHFEENSQAEGNGDIRDFGVEWLGTLDRTNYPFGLSIDDLGNEFSLNVQIDHSLSTEMIYSYMETALQGIVKGLHDSNYSDTLLLNIDIMSANERKTQLFEWNPETKPYPSESSIMELFEEHVRSTPNRIAVEFGNEVLTYGQLNALANQLAEYLLDQGIEPDTLVGLCLNRSIEMVVAMLGILKAGGAYVPVDPDYPVGRINHIFNDSGIKILLTTRSLAESLPVSNQLLVYMDTDSNNSLFGYRSTTDLSAKQRRVRPNHLAYVIYTSGSTGKPKGVLVEQRGVVRLVRNPDYFKADSQTVMLHHMSISFDVGSQEVLIPLLNGGRLVIFQGDAKDIHQIVDCIHHKGVNMMSLSAAFLPAFAESVRKRPVDLKYLGVGGESFSARDVKAIYDCLDSITIVNAYGPTENSIASTCYEIPRDIDSDSVIPIGQPISQTEVYIVDKNLNLIPTGVVGELCVGGVGVARGYLNNPNLTKERFVKNPFSEKENDRLYRTGDLVRWRSDGQLEFKGRIDHQVKVRGYRIELGEVENALVAHPNVYNAVVSTHLAEGGDKKLVAHVSPTSEYLDKFSKLHNDDHLKRWTVVFDDQYAGDNQEEYKAVENYIGWNSSYTNEPIQQDQMQEWVSGTVDRIKSLNPKRLLEIGCGTGLLLYRYAPICDFVQAIDISAFALSGIQKQLNQKQWNHVKLAQSDAIHLEAFAEERFDTVVANSVIQYFPNRLYLEQMIYNTIQCMEPGGKIFIGDVRNLDLFEAHLYGIELCQNNSPISYEAMASQIHRREQQETELLVSPSFFVSLTDQIPEIERVDILVKKGVGDNEMLSYRYDVVLTMKDGSYEDTNENPAIEWYAFNDMKDVYRLFESNTHTAFGISGLVNGRVQEDVKNAEKILRSRARGVLPAVKRRRRLTESTIDQIKNLNNLIQFAEERGYRCELTWSQSHAAHLDIIFAKGCMPTVQAKDSYRVRRFTNYPQISSLGHALSRVLKDDLSGTLPDYMIPSTFVVLEKFPLTLNGKVDRSALPKPDDSDFMKADYAEPHNEIERKICYLFQELMDVERVGRYDDFFDLGGHSLIAVQLISRLKQMLGRDFPLKLIFENATVESIAAAVQSQSQSQLNDEKALVASKRTDHGVPLSQEQQELWFLSNDDFMPSHENVLSTYCVTGKVNVESLIRSVKEVVVRHEVLRTSFIDIGGEIRQIVNSPSEFKPQIIKIETESQFTELCQEEKHCSFDRNDQYLFRFYWIELTNDEHYVLISRPWGLFDGWSTGLFMGELVVLYEHYNRDRTLDFPQPGIQYSDYVIWQKSVYSNALLDDQIEYWRKTLENCSGKLHFVPDVIRNELRNSAEGSLEISLPTELVHTLKQFCRQNDVTLYMVLLSAYAVLLMQYTDQQDICIGSPVSKRSRPELEQVIGYFVNIVVMRLRLTGEMRYSELASLTKKVAVEAFANKDVPFSRLMEILRAESAIEKQSPLFNVMFNLIRIPEANHEISDLTLIPITTNKDKTNYDLNLVLHETSSSIQGYMEYNTDHFKQSTIESMVGKYLEILKRVAEEPDVILSNLILESDIDSVSRR
ncbi:non-ribosomal peptide synthetase [Bacillus velezensis]|uniref:non-ribosomal peptide synthetase n=1 Tax=Bacillus amyloliquefaciens group TaxID=1938374 RepID=UPI000B5DD2F7|nr:MULTISPECIES: non-ribosomal peptide synthetase [Bacillus amyloliquefaciens group]ASB52635.1 Linear gramicidin synthase subunit B [Bacillus velezensis]MCM8506885.1 amino acid adenylation domain-containing protein [Bacillus amyloliquefaciens]MCT6683381.1 non-ribosomal peptide synthetase [Bacillus velezensis]QMT25918.1 amino acid adenylation domain-containing protein [Bacillus velezensis]WBY42187.1 non-ribosomal peptide synthetase [Bacillus velezensis]